ncbi:GNAT family N-acetyltransferase [Gordonia sp. SL306]|uniref:GNAT family N-acetyltransferase n=1 Tax=Gordonia sp. SL306 TaxID=2995145 RepID=UPI00226DCA2F|nr:GNAT family N-acetyltransferase [Gordonia sp. SL306]WAC54348.1 GNAT family N-acetyltransferase [Gordonia sp. SL306]
MSNLQAASSALTVARATDADWDEIFATDARAFLMTNPLSAAEQADMRGKVDDADVVLVRDPDGLAGRPLVGVSMFYRMAMTLPGGAAHPAAGLSWVSVAATHRRRGILRTMITDLFDQWEAEDQLFAILTASEATIYERFGFGPTCFAQDVTVDLGAAKMRHRADRAHSPVNYATGDEVARHIPELHARWTATRPGALARPQSWWDPILADRASQRPAHSSGMHYLLHPDGYAAYRINQSTQPTRGDIAEVVAATDEAHTDLWRVLVGLDLMPTVTASIPVDDPLPVSLTNHRAVSVTGVRDTMWLRILDVPRALGSRRFAADLDVVIEVTDEFRGRGGIFDVSIRDGGAIVAPSSATPTVRMDISVLGSIFLGGTPARRFAAAERLWTDSADTLAALDRAFATDRAPFAGTFF